MNLPPDFWSKPDAFGGIGLAIGFLIGFPLSYYLFPDTNGLGWYWQYGKGKITVIVSTTLGALIGEIVRLFWLGYLP
jgi:hypothetical protein